MEASPPGKNLSLNLLFDPSSSSELSRSIPQPRHIYADRASFYQEHRTEKHPAFDSVNSEKKSQHWEGPLWTKTEGLLASEQWRFDPEQVRGWQRPGGIWHVREEKIDTPVQRGPDCLHEALTLPVK